MLNILQSTLEALLSTPARTPRDLRDKAERIEDVKAQIAAFEDGEAKDRDRLSSYDESWDAETWHGDVNTATQARAVRHSDADLYDKRARAEWDAEIQAIRNGIISMAQALCQPQAAELPTPPARHPEGNVRQGDTPAEIKAADQRTRWGWDRGTHETSKR